MSSSAKTQRFALLSVYDKAGIVDFARGLVEAGFALLSSGGTAKALREAGLEVTDVASYTASPEVMGGRVKTLHPRVHGGILMRDTPQDRAELAQLGGAPIDLVCVNLYPFEATVASGAEEPAVIEQIDIGGPAMIRAAAKNFARVAVVTDPQDYATTLKALALDEAQQRAHRRKLSACAFARTAQYDAAISAYLMGAGAEAAAESEPSTLRYGENPHQEASVHQLDEASGRRSLAGAAQLNPSAKALSYNNYVDADAALVCVAEFDEPAAVVVKHANPCGVAQGAELAETYLRAREADPVSAFGGIVALNRPCDAATAKRLAETFLEVVIAPDYSAEALALLGAKKNLRVLAVDVVSAGTQPLLRAIDGGLLRQSADPRILGDEVSEARCVTQVQPTTAQRADLLFAWRVCKHVKSNAIVVAGEGRTLGVGAGQMSRVLSVGLAAQQAGESAKGAVMASDAFFPFADGLEAAAAAGIQAVVQPGGSKRDDEVIAAADAAGIAMLFVGRRHFRH